MPDGTKSGLEYGYLTSTEDGRTICPSPSNSPKLIVDSVAGKGPDSLMLCAVYARYSSDLQELTSIGDQHAECEKYAERRGWTIAGKGDYDDPETPGTYYDGRPGLDRLRQDAKSGLFGCVLIYHTSRISRELGRVAEFVKEMDFYGVRVIFTSQGIDSRQPEYEDSLVVHGFSDRYANKATSKQTLKAMKGHFRSGYAAGGRVYGYINTPVPDPNGGIDKKTKAPKLLGSLPTIKTDQARIVCDIFSMYLEGLSIRDITHWLNSHGYPPPYNSQQTSRGLSKPAWLTGTVRNMLSNEKYNGEWIFNRGHWKKFGRSRKWFEHPRDEWEIQDRPELRIVDEDIWRAVQAKLQAGKRGPINQSRHRTNTIWAGGMKCEVCSGNFVQRSNSARKDILFACSTNKNRGLAACTNHLQLRESQLRDTFLNYVQRELLTPTEIQAVVEKVRAALKRKMDNLQRDAVHIETDRETIKRRLDAAYELLLSDPKDSMFREGYEKARADMDRLDSTQKRLNKRLVLDKYCDYDYVAGWLGRLKELIASDPMKAKASLFSLFGPLTLSPVAVDGANYLRVRGNIKVDGLLMLASGRDPLAVDRTNTGGQI